MRQLLLALLTLTFIACGGKSGNGSDAGNTGGDDGGGDGNNGNVDAPALVPPGCTAPDLTKPQCSNCIDDDGDGFADSFDIECTGPTDNDESSFSTGIPGDNIDAVKQDCFFDGNSGGGDDGCDIHVCCLLGAATVADCPIGQNQYDPANCPPPIGTTPLSQLCIDTCGALTPPGCDCFGCCTLCDPNNPSMCYDVITNPATSPDCTADVLADPTKCHTCTQVPSCGNPECGGTTCILCPGQTQTDLPAECNGTTTCPSGVTSCAGGAACPANTACDAGSQCCVGIIL
ncbi:MAG: putative secreted protein [Deltaproteobacteria bacterium]|nr:putative secreted protein [Deltaproteobacteria bacterium]